MRATLNESPHPPAGPWRPALVAALALYAALAWRFNFVCDDAYISFRYSRHLAEGHGLVFNLGRKPPVEGYSNFLWVLLCAAFEWVHFAPALGSRLVSFLCGVVLILSVQHFAARRLGLQPRAQLATGLFMASLPATGVWATSGLATMPTVLCVFLAYQALLGDPTCARGFQAGLAMLATALLRADGAAWGLVLLGTGTLLWILRGRPSGLLRAMMIAGGVLALGVALHLFWRHSFYGLWLPNTARVKAGFSPARLHRGLLYLATMTMAMPALLLLAGLVPRRLRFDRVHVWIPSLAMVVAAAGYAVWVGGDFMPFGRFLMPALPFLTLLLACVLCESAGKAGASRLVLPLAGIALPTLSLLAAFDITPFPDSLRKRLDFRLDRPDWQSEVARWADMRANTERWVVLGRALGMHTKLGESMIIGGMGAQAYYSELFVYDNYGLVTPEVVEQGRIIENASPGHDMRVATEFFYPPPHGNFHDKITYLGAAVVASADHRGSPGQKPPSWAYLWSDDFQQWWSGGTQRQYVDEITIPLQPVDGFPEGALLLLMRFKWARR